MLVHGVRHHGHRRYVAIIPEPAFVKWLAIGGRVNFRFLGRDHRPAALRFDPAQPRQRLRLRPADASTVRHLVETVPRGDRPDPYRLEQNVVARIAAHEASTASIVWPSKSTIRSSSASVTM